MARGGGLFDVWARLDALTGCLGCSTLRRPPSVCPLNPTVICATGVWPHPERASAAPGGAAQGLLGGSGCVGQVFEHCADAGRFRVVFEVDLDLSGVVFEPSEVDVASPELFEPGVVSVEC
jgi:hypothetical protein